MPPFMSGPQQTDLHLAPWSGQTIKVRFVLHTNYDPSFFSYSVPPGFIIGTVVRRRIAGPSKVYISNLRIDNTCKVDSVDFQAIDSEIDTNPITPFGKRIFSDKQSLSDSADRSLVCVVAHTSAPNCPVTFRVLDVDDPPRDPLVDPNDDGDDNDSRGVSGLTSVTGCVATSKSGAGRVAGPPFAPRSFRATTTSSSPAGTRTTSEPSRARTRA